MSNQSETTRTENAGRLEWGGLRAFDARLRGWAGQVRSYCLREGFDNADNNNNNNNQ